MQMHMREGALDELRVPLRAVRALSIAMAMHHGPYTMCHASCTIGHVPWGCTVRVLLIAIL